MELALIADASPHALDGMAGANGRGAATEWSGVTAALPLLAGARAIRAGRPLAP